MGNCFGRIRFPRIHSFKSHHKNVVLLLVGLDNAGKTTAAKNLVGEPLETVVSTVGFSRISVTHQGCSVSIYDLGGGPKIRGIWHRYFADVHGIIFIVDSSDVSRLEESRQVFENLLSHKKLEGKPVLLLANKQDRDEALDELDIVDRLNVEAVVNQYRCPTKVELCSATAVKKSRKKQDSAIHNGFRWLMNYIVREYGDLNTRVESDMAVERKQIEQEKKERLERIRKAREERGESMADAVTANGTCNGGVDDTDFDDVTANPFKPVAVILEDIKKSAAPVVEPVLDSRIILVKESPKKIQPNDEEKQNSLDGGSSNKQTSNVKRFMDIDSDEVALVTSAGSRKSLRSDDGNKNWFGSAASVGQVTNSLDGGNTNKQTSNVKRFMDIDGDEVALVTSAESRKSLRSDAGNKNWFGSAASVGQVPSPTHSITGLIKDQLELKEVQHKKHWFFHRKNRTAPGPLGPAGSQFPVTIKKKQSVTGKSNLFCIRSGSASSEHLENSDSHSEKCKSSHETNLADGKNELKFIDSKVQPLNTTGSLSPISSNSFASQGNEGSQDLRDQVSAIPIKQWSTDKRSMSIEDSYTTCHQLRGAEKSVPKQQSCDESKSRGTSRQNSAQQGEMRLKKQSSVDETSSSGTRSQMGSQHLNDSGFVSPKNVLPPIRLASSGVKPSWILPPLSSQTKHSSQDSLLELDKPEAGAASAKLMSSMTETLKLNKEQKIVEVQECNSKLK